MKDLPKIFKGFLLLAGVLAAWQPAALGQTRQKKFSKTYTVSPDPGLTIDNQFGNVIIHTWDKNQVKADVNILVKHGNDSRAEQLLGAIEIIENADGDNISLRTSIGKDKPSQKGSSSMQINYEVYVPAAVRLTLVNKFGNTSLPDLKGSTEIRQSFGDLETGSLAGDENELFVEFSEGSTRIGTVKNLDGDFRFSNISIAGLTGDTEIDVQHCGKFHLGAGTRLSSLELDANYTNVTIDLAENFSGEFDVSTNFGDFKYGGRVRLNEPAAKEEGRGPKFKFNYAGRIGEGGNSSLAIQSSFSSITFR